MCKADLPTLRPTPLPQDNHRLGWTTFLRHPITHLLTAWAGGSTTFHSPKGPERLHGLSITMLDV